MKTEIIHAMVQHVLDNARKYEWSVQGFGMLRTYLPLDMRLNIWSRALRIPNVSLIHNHPWHFDSYIERGSVGNRRFLEINDKPPTHCRAIIKPGLGGGIREPRSPVCLRALATEFYYSGDTYHQDAHEIHLSDPVDGTVTVNARTRIGADEATVFWPLHTEWISAEPRPATDEEVDVFIAQARRRFHAR